MTDTVRACDEANRGRWADALPATEAQLARLAALAEAAGLAGDAYAAEVERLHGCAPADLSRWAANLMAAWLAVRVAAASGQEAA